jgi:hypothetical protein
MAAAEHDLDCAVFVSDLAGATAGWAGIRSVHRTRRARHRRPRSRTGCCSGRRQRGERLGDRTCPLSRPARSGSGTRRVPSPGVGARGRADSQPRCVLGLESLGGELQPPTVLLAPGQATESTGSGSSRRMAISFRFAALPLQKTSYSVGLRSPAATISRRVIVGLMRAARNCRSGGGSGHSDEAMRRPDWAMGVAARPATHITSPNTVGPGALPGQSTMQSGKLLRTRQGARTFFRSAAPGPVTPSKRKWDVAGMADMAAVRDISACRSSSTDSAGRLWIVLPALLPRLCGGVRVWSGPGCRPDFLVG